MWTRWNISELGFFAGEAKPVSRHCHLQANMIGLDYKDYIMKTTKYQASKFHAFECFAIQNMANDGKWVSGFQNCFCLINIYNRRAQSLASPLLSSTLNACPRHL